MFLVRVFTIFVYYIVYDIAYDIRKNADIVHDMQNSHHYYTILHAYIVCTIAIIRYCMPKSIKTYDDIIRYSIRFSFHVPGPAFAAGWHWPCPWSAHRSCLMILGPPGWSVLHHHSHDALSLSLACATANVSGDSLVQAKMVISS